MDGRLHTAVRYGNINGVLEALKGGFNPNDIGLFQWSPIHEAANNGERDILKLLVDYKGDVNLQDKLHGNTPLHYAAREDNSACVTVLLKAGARIDIKNYEGMTCLDEATSLCREIIHKFVNSRNAGSDWKGEKNDPIQKQNMGLSDVWGQVPGIPEQAAIGQLHLSFEYQKLNLSIRVWQVSDLLLPPPQISMIESIFVRSYLIPDPVNKTNRHTEAVRVHSQTKDSTLPPHSGIQHIFSPSSFEFETALLYTGVTQDIIVTRSVRLEVCMTQKNTRKAFLMGMLHMPLRTAVRHPIREIYPLIACQNHTIPNSMRVYSARDIIFGNSSSLDQSLSRSESMHSSFSCPPASRDIDTGSVEHYLLRASSELTDSDCDDGVGSSSDVISTLGKSRTSSAGTVDVICVGGDVEETSGFRESVVPHSEVYPKSAEHVNSKEHSKPKRKIIPNELLDKVSLSDKDVDGAALTVMKTDYISSTEAHKTDEGLSPEPHISTENTLQNLPTGKKKIIPPEILSTGDNSFNEHELPGNHNSNQGDLIHENTCVYDEIQSSHTNQSYKDTAENSFPAIQNTDKLAESSDVEGGYKEDGTLGEQQSEIAEIRRSQRAFLETSDASSTPVSRPETPIWDFYDFTLEESVIVGPEAEAASPGDDAAVALGTLQESVLRLSRASKVLDTCVVTGPVLPAVMIEDFEMEDDIDNDDDNDDDGGSGSGSDDDDDGGDDENVES